MWLVGEAAWNATIDDAPVKLQALRRLPAWGRLRFVYVLTRPKAIALRTRTRRCAFDLADPRARRRAAYLREFTLELKGEWLTFRRPIRMRDVVPPPRASTTFIFSRSDAQC